MSDISIEQILAMTDKVFIALPTSEQARYSDFYENLDRVICPPQTVRQSVKGIYISNSQNELARMFLASEAEYFWLINDDQLYPQETLLRLLEHRKDVIGVNAVMKSAPHPPLVYEKSSGNSHFPYRFFKRGEHGLVRVGGLAGGGTLIHRRVFEAIPDPWWEVHTVKPDDGGKPTQSSEDFDFCQKVTDAGFELYCDLDVHVAHGATFWLMPEMLPTGEWITALIRNEEKLIVPAAVDPDVPQQEPMLDLYRELAVYTKQSADLVRARCESARVELAWQWEKRRDAVGFYRSTDLYIFDLTGYQTSLHQAGWYTDFIETLMKLKPSRVLDFGGGIGEASITAWRWGARDIDYVDVRNSETMRYAEHRFLTHAVAPGCLKTHGEDFKIQGRYDLIIAMDVLEHLPDPDRLLRQFVAASEYLIANPEQIPYNALYPQHISKPDLSRYYRKVGRDLWRRL